MQKIVVEKDSYFDSVVLMLASQEIRKHEGVRESVVAMATGMNIDLLRDMGFDADWEHLSPGDLIIAIMADDEQSLQAAVTAAGELLRRKEAHGGEEEEYRPDSLEGAVRIQPESNLVLISVPGRYAAREARRALQKGLHVMLFSDNVSLDEEIELKTLAGEKGLLMMGPDCGTAIINGRPLCFANRVRRGDIGIVGASGTGIQEVTCSIHQFGGGISQAVGTGGRDLKSSRVGGTTMLMAIEALGNDPDTRVIAVISKPPEPELVGTIVERLEKTGKPGIIHFIGVGGEASGSGGQNTVRFTGSLEETARQAVALSRGEKYVPFEFSMPEEEIDALVAEETSRMGREQKYLRGLFTGGTLADEAMILLQRSSVEIYSNNQIEPDLTLEDPRNSIRDTIVDLGDDMFTVGRPHPMIDPTIRTERIRREMQDPEVALLLMDVVLGYGSHPDPGGVLAEAVTEARKTAAERGGYLAVIVSVIGTEEDVQNLQAQKRKLEGSGCIVMPSNFQASLLALRMIEEVRNRWM